MINVSKVLSGAALGAIISISSLSSAHAAVLPQSQTTAKIEVKQEQASVTITKERAQAIALNKCQGAVQSVQMHRENGINFYHVNVLGQDGRQHDFKINCRSGNVVRHDIEKKQIAITVEKAHAIALKQCQGKVQYSEMTREHGANFYHVRVLGHDGFRHDFKINCQNGNIVSHDVQKHIIITKEKAQRIALNKCQGKVQYSEMTREHGANFYHVRVLGHDGFRHDFKINCENGNIVSHDVQKQIVITKEKAHRIALGHFSGVVQTSNMIKEHGVNFYNVKVLGQDGRQHDVKVNCESGKVVKQVTYKKVVAITVEKAHFIALKHQNGSVYSSEMARENGAFIYKVNVLGNDGHHHEVKVNCENGHVVR